MRGTPRAAVDATFLMVSFNSAGEIESVTALRAPLQDGARAADARAVITGAKKYHVYRIKKASADDLAFERLK